MGRAFFRTDQPGWAAHASSNGNFGAEERTNGSSTIPRRSEFKAKAEEFLGRRDGVVNIFLDGEICFNGWLTVLGVGR
jgi:hypothetical protein